MKILKVLIGLFVFIGIYVLIVNFSVQAAESDEEIAAKYGVTFPIAELGNCANLSECRTYCEDPVNTDACISFAKSKGFYEESEFEVDEAVVKKAKQSLGCDSLSSCISFCEREENFDKCHRFAQAEDLVGGYTRDPGSAEILNKAKEALGCDSYETCRSFCDNPANRDKCSQFAASVGVRGGYEYKGPGGCTSEGTCSAFCSNPGNLEICRQYSQSYGGSFVGPGGCTDEASCRAFCEKNPQACGDSSGSNYQRDYNPEEMCRRTPSCKWENNTCQCGFYEAVDKNYDPATECKKYGCSWSGNYCQCGQTDTQYQDQLKAECSKYPGCSWSGSYCQCSTTDVNYSGDPATECVKYSGCAWKDNSCQCSSSPTSTGGTSQQGSEGVNYQTPYPTSGNSGYQSSGTSQTGTSGSYDPATECSKTSGCSWNGSSCQCSSSGDSTGTSSQPYDPATECAKTSGCSWDGSTCQCSSVQGISTEGFLQKLLKFLFGR